VTKVTAGGVDGSRPGVHAVVTSNRYIVLM
jgi:hypothetical protein